MRAERLSPTSWLALAVAFMAVCCHRGGPTDELAAQTAAGPKHVTCAPIVDQDVEDVVEIRGTVAPLFGKDALIAPQVAGRVLRVLVREGDRVRDGQELARIDDATLADQSRQADAVIAKAQAETELARTTEARVRRVFDRGIAAKQDLDDASARSATARAGEAEARAAGAIARRVLTRASVRSPLAGVVLKVFRKPGELVDGTPATPVVEVGDPTQLELAAIVTAADLVQIHAAATAHVEVPVMPNRPFAGRVALVSPAVDRVTGLGTVRVRLDLKGVDTPPIGVTGIARIDVGRHSRRSLAPAAALRAPDGSQAEIALCGRDGRAHIVRVSVGRERSGLVEITGTATGARAGANASVNLGSATPGPPAITAGALVVIDPVLGIDDGDPISSVP
jgi:RND family efflux transporter MFP subunit